MSKERLYAVRMDGYRGASPVLIELPGGRKRRFDRGETDRDAEGYPYDEFTGTEKQARGLREAGLSVEPIPRSQLRKSAFAEAPAIAPGTRPERPPEQPPARRSRTKTTKAKE